MTFEEIKPYLQQGKIGRLPNYKGYFYWSWGLDKPYMKNGDYSKIDLDNELLRDDWYYIV